MNDVLVIDDNQILANILSEIFRESGYTVRTASDGFAALASIRERVPDVLISDLNMPRMSGFELLSIVRRRFPSIAVIAMSGSYFGVAVPQGVAADAFYAKGSTSVARLFEILRPIKDEATRNSIRGAAPIWIPRVPIDDEALATFAISCPECLRTFPHCLQNTKLLRIECLCPHCHHQVELAVAGSTTDTDQTGIGKSGNLRQIGLRAYLRNMLES
jgi:CheY-like chemotaxis protein